MIENPLTFILIALIAAVVVPMLGAFVVYWARRAWLEAQNDHNRRIAKQHRGDNPPWG